jgi:hypothetical protein
LTLGGPRCSAEALSRDEPLFATASLVSSWLLLEQPGAWGPEALGESRFPDEVTAEIRSRVGGGVRILLIRHRDEPDETRNLFMAYSGGIGRAPWLTSATFTKPEEILDLDLESLVSGDPDGAPTVSGPIYLVCTHGRHDICCADKGRPLYRALSELRPDRTWEVSHIGGDRFAGNLLVLPRGDYFGRLEPEDADSMVAGYEAGRLHLTHHRGRSIQPRLVQAAEHFVRETEGLAGFDDLTVVEYRRASHDRAEVVFDGPDGARFVVRVSAHELPDPVYLTCRANEPGRPVAYEVDSFSRSVR